MSLVVSCVSFTVYLAINGSNNLDPNKAFVSILLFNMMKEPFNFIPYMINQFLSVGFWLHINRNAVLYFMFFLFR